jgi:predicted transcriptional regulator
MPRTYLTEEEVREIREKVSQGLSTYKVAEAYKVSQSYVSKLARGLNRAAEMQRDFSTGRKDRRSV